MGTHRDWVPHINLRTQALTPMEEKVIRMRYGLPAYEYSRLDSGPTASPSTAAALRQLESQIRDKDVSRRLGKKRR